jgi:hypothetical protein
MRTLRPPSAGRLHLFGVDTTFKEDEVDDACALKHVRPVVAICFQLFDARSTLKVVSRASSVSFTARMEHVVWCLLFDGDTDVLGCSVCKCCSVHDYILQHFVYCVK